MHQQNIKGLWSCMNNEVSAIYGEKWPDIIASCFIGPKQLFD